MNRFELAADYIVKSATDLEAEDAERERKARIRNLLLAAAGAVGVGSLGYLGWRNRDAIANLISTPKKPPEETSLPKAVGEFSASNPASAALGVTMAAGRHLGRLPGAQGNNQFASTLRTILGSDKKDLSGFVASMRDKDVAAKLYPELTDGQRAILANEVEQAYSANTASGEGNKAIHSRLAGLAQFPAGELPPIWSKDKTGIKDRMAPHVTKPLVSGRGGNTQETWYGPQNNFTDPGGLSDLANRVRKANLKVYNLSQHAGKAADKASVATSNKQLADALDQYNQHNSVGFKGRATRVGLGMAAPFAVDMASGLAGLLRSEPTATELK